jgi:hypothetical protein
MEASYRMVINAMHAQRHTASNLDNPVAIAPEFRIGTLMVASSIIS